MTNFEYIMENMTVRELAKGMNPIRSGFAREHIFGRAWYAWNKHCSMMEGYQKNHGNVYSPDKPVNPFSWSRYATYVDGIREAVEGHSEIVSYDTWLCKQYNPEEWD